LEPYTTDQTSGADTVKVTAEFLCADLDGTILIGDSFWESLVALLERHFWYGLLIPFWFFRGKAALKHEIARRVLPNVSTFPIRAELIEYLRQQKCGGKKLILATGADTRIAHAVANHLGLFDAVLASDGATNLTGERKKEAIQRFAHGRGFEYIGNSWNDLPTWKTASAAILVEPSRRLLRTVQKTVPCSSIFERRKSRWASIWKLLRPHHWVKNLLVFVPIVMAHKANQLPRLLHVLVACASFSLCASGVYVLNDLFDLEADRLHPKKKFRPFASGEVPLWAALGLLPLLFLAGLAVSAQLRSVRFLEIILVYLGATTIYSTYAKRIPILDVLFLTALYLLRILGGGAAAQVPVSPWLLAFSMFLLLSLAFTKRHAELLNEKTNRGEHSVISKREYQVQDRELVQQFGVTSGYLSVLVLALYINGSEVISLYRHPQLIWLACPMLLFWISRVWFLANRGKLHEDPVVFAACDPFSYLLGFLLLLILLVAA
jgi:4-hydroxybenzoate polyprenyltransferase